ncbi:nuclear transport factor 2 family protein [Burkholderia sp. Bp9140]|uniref:nuclear transport factor 2 family protein n=1 Tax=Burkholderia sp. Bp9140 TaxID=2184572 RepID=UPI000F5747C1|nr:nuclear transport factor 2 family protein [Burkholderia sp. Bp9140]RQR51334.1 nuclear transport factor 2 family protein [Burkholderia sp. Bp9140]
MNFMTDEVKKLEESRWTAMMAADIDSLDRLLSDQLSWVHSSGHCDGKAELVRRIATGQVTYLSIERISDVRAHGEGTVVITGQVQMRVLAEGREIELKNQYTNVWVNEHGRWQMVSWQSTQTES